MTFTLYYLLTGVLTDEQNREYAIEQLRLRLTGQKITGLWSTESYAQKEFERYGKQLNYRGIGKLVIEVKDL